MDFIIHRFILFMKSFGLEVICNFYRNDNHYEILFHNLPSELDMNLVKTHYMEFVGKESVVIDKYVKDARPVEKDVFADCYVCVPIEYSHESYLKVVLNENDYAKKLNFITREVSDYFHNIPVCRWDSVLKQKHEREEVEL